MFFPKNAKILLIYQRFTDKTVHLCCRPPRGGRGLKYPVHVDSAAADRSPPSRGAWIEILSGGSTLDPRPSRPPRGGRGLKCMYRTMGGNPWRRPPRGGRGLKYDLPARAAPPPASPPSRGAWIEISVVGARGVNANGCRPPRGGRGLKYPSAPGDRCTHRRPPRGGRGLK